jgi:hypothetical protein
MGRWSEIERGSTAARGGPRRPSDFAPQNAARPAGRSREKSPENARSDETFRSPERILKKATAAAGEGRFRPSHRWFRRVALHGEATQP